MTEILNWIMDLIRAYGAWSVFVGVIIESVIIPIPSPLVIMGAGFILINSDLTVAGALIPILLLIVLPGSLASTLGAYVGYGLGFFGGKPLVQRWKGFFGFSWEDVDILQKRLRGDQVNMTIFLLRAVPIIPLSLISMAAGFVRLSITPFTLWTFYGSVLRCLILGYLGWGIGETYYGLAHGIDRVETAVSLFIILALLGGIIWLRGKIGISILKK
ncbi:MAG: VTT domain-containing protein [Candidatus Aerophobetes bacterium]|jgi:membrane protein DedA with SNARE-associated domain